MSPEQFLKDQARIRLETGNTKNLSARQKEDLIERCVDRWKTELHKGEAALRDMIDFAKRS